MKPLAFLYLLLSASLLFGCSSDDEPGVDPATTGDTTGTGADATGDTGGDTDGTPDDAFSQAGFPVVVESTGDWSVGPLSGYAAGGGAYAGAFATRAMEGVSNFILGYYSFSESGEAWAPATAAGFDAETGALTLDGDVQAKLELLGPGRVGLTITAAPGANRVSASFACHADDRFIGFGAQTPAMEHRGQRVPIWVSEQGLGKNALIPEDELPPPPFSGRIYDAYYPVPMFLSPRRGYGMVVENTERIVFELCSADSNAWRVEAWADELKLVLFIGDSPTHLIERYTDHVGKPPAVPDWSLLPWISIKGGQDHVEERVDALLAAEIPASAIWSEDWLGEVINPFTGNNIKYHWEWDPEHYPDLKGLIDDLHANDLKFLGYFNPFVVDFYDEWDEATTNGWLPKTPEGEDYGLAVLTQFGSVADLTHPDAKQWLLDHMKVARDLGMDGWMADYAEWVPVDAVFADGRTGAQVSSDYPRLWQQINQQACSGECVFFVRSGFTGSNALAPAAWGGDQNTDFGQDDGLPTALRIGVGLGLSGVAFYGSDIAGYTSAVSPPSDKELYYRWTELGAFQPIMRTHEGNSGPENWNYDEDAETLAHFKRYAEWHTRLFPFWKALLAAAAQTGVPVIRHPALHYPDSDAAMAEHNAYLLGDSLYVAPIVTRGATSREVALPPGKWVDWQSGLRVEGTITAEASLEEIPLYLREGGLVVMLQDTVRTTSAAQAAADTALEVHAVTNGDATLGDFTWTSDSSGDPGDGGLPTCEAAERDCTMLDGPRRTYRLTAATLELDNAALTGPTGPEVNLVVYFQ